MITQNFHSIGEPRASGAPLHTHIVILTIFLYALHKSRSCEIAMQCYALHRTTIQTRGQSRHFWFSFNFRQSWQKGWTAWTFELWLYLLMIIVNHFQSDLHRLLSSWLHRFSTTVRQFWDFRHNATADSWNNTTEFHAFAPGMSILHYLHTSAKFYASVSISYLICLIQSQYLVI